MTLPGYRRLPVETLEAAEMWGKFGPYTCTPLW